MYKLSNWYRQINQVLIKDKEVDLTPTENQKLLTKLVYIMSYRTSCSGVALHWLKQLFKNETIFVMNDCFLSYERSLILHGKKVAILTQYCLQKMFFSAIGVRVIVFLRELQKMFFFDGTIGYGPHTWTYFWPLQTIWTSCNTIWCCWNS